MSFELDGFLSPDMASFKEALFSDENCKPWFELACDLIRCGLQVLRSHESLLADQRQMIVSGLFARTHQTLQAAVLLIESGLINDARSLIRTGVEGAIALNALASDPTFVAKLESAHLKHQGISAKFILDDVEILAQHPPELRQEIESTLAKIAAQTAAGNKPTGIKWDQVASVHCKILYQTLYRLLSADGIHAGLISLDRFYETDSNGKITKLNCGPNAAGAVDTLSCACLMFLWAVDPFVRFFGYREILDSLQEPMRRFQKLPRLEPSW